MSTTPPRSESRKQSSIDIATLLIAAVASALAAWVTSTFWQGGALWSAAISPVIVAIVKDVLARPADKIKTTTRLVRDRTTGRTEAIEVPVEDDEQGEAPGVPEIGAPTQEHGDVQIYGRSRKRWTVAIVTGLLAFAIAAVVVTVPELVSGSSLGGGGGHSGTTFFGGSSKERDRSDKSDKSKDGKAKPGSTATPTAAPGERPTATPEATASPTPTATASPMPTPSASPEPTTTPPEP